MSVAPERRQFPRLHSHLPIRFQPAGSPRFIDTLTKDLSTGGVRFITERFLPTTSEVTLELLLYRNAEPVRGRAKVAWTQHVRYSDQYHVGLMFLDLPPDHQRELLTYLHDALMAVPSIT